MLPHLSHSHHSLQTDPWSPQQTPCNLQAVSLRMCANLFVTTLERMQCFMSTMLSLQQEPCAALSALHGTPASSRLRVYVNGFTLTTKVAPCRLKPAECEVVFVPYVQVCVPAEVQLTHSFRNSSLWPGLFCLCSQQHNRNAVLKSKGQDPRCFIVQARLRPCKVLTVSGLLLKHNRRLNQKFHGNQHACW